MYSFQSVPLHCHKTRASVRLGKDSPKLYIALERYLHDTAGKTPIVTIQQSLSNLNTKISYNSKNIKAQKMTF